MPRPSLLQITYPCAGYATIPTRGAAPTIDGQAVNTSTWHSNATSATVTLSTTNAGDAVVIYALSEGGTPDISSVSSANTTGWTHYATFHGGPTRPMNIDIWYGFASAALSSEVITVNTATGVDAGIILALAFNSAGKAYANSPFDADPSLPATGTYQDYSTFVQTSPTLSGISAAETTGMFLSMYITSASTYPETAGSGFSVVRSDLASNVHNIGATLENKSYTTAQSGVTVAFGSTSFDWTMLVCAIRRS